MELIIVTYHYILPENKYKKGIYPISSDRFLSHLITLSKTYTFISETDLVLAIKRKKELPDKACLISFDDGLRSQYKNAVPILEDKKIPALFFISTQPYIEKKGAVVHKLHYLLAHIDIKILLDELEITYKELKKETINWNLINKKKIKNWYIYDNEKTAIFKYLLNHLFPAQLSSDITSIIFNKFYKSSEEKFCQELYITPKNIKKLGDSRLFSIGLHSHSHIDISKFSLNEVVQDFKKNADTLHNIFRIDNINGLSYPYGITDDGGEENKIEAVTKTLSLTYGVTTEKGVNINFSNPLLLKRFNPNDIDNLS